MKRTSLITAVMTMSLLSSASFGQEECKVLMPSISGKYTGSCKQGLADGKGEASGTDRYVGEFRKGFPDGEGTYFWQAGEIYKGEWKKGLREGKGELTMRLAGRDSVLSGIWKEDKYVGKETVSAYVIGYRNNVGRVTFMKNNDDRSYIKYKFSRSGGESATFMTINDLLLQGSSGTENISFNFTGFDNVTFPFQGKVQFTAPNAMNTSTLTCEVRFTINEPGSWLVTIFY